MCTYSSRAALVCVALVAIASCTMTIAAEVDEPIRIPCDDDHPVDVTVREATLTITGEETLSFRTRLYHVMGDDGLEPMYPAPTLVLQAGEQCRFTLKNELSETSGAETCESHENGFHCADTTNLHMHGLHLPFSEDEVVSPILPGHSKQYVYNIPADHPAGVAWYHAHYHGSSGLHVAGGMAGAVLVENSSVDMPADLAAAYVDAKLLKIGHFRFGESTTGAFGLHSYPSLSAQYSPQPIDPAPTGSLASSHFLAVNSEYQPEVDIAPGSVRVLRLLYGTTFETVELELVDASGWCTMTMLARDGVFQATPFLTVDAVVMMPGARADIAVQCSAEAAGSTIHVRAHPDPARDDVLGSGNRVAQDIVFSLRVAAAVPASPVAMPTTTVAMPASMTSLGTSTPDVTFDISFAANAVNGIAFPGVHAPFDELFPHQLCLDSVVQINLVGQGGGGGDGAGRQNVPPGVHPYHQHVQHFQVVPGNRDATGVIVRDGEWRDSLPSRNGVSLRFSPDRLGILMMHCHILQHEDLGMMALYYVGVCCADETDCPENAACGANGYCECSAGYFGADCEPCPVCPSGDTCSDGMLGSGTCEEETESEADGALSPHGAPLRTVMLALAAALALLM